MSGIWVGTSGWRYAAWRGPFYPAGLPARLELGYAGSKFNSIEINGTFYGLQRPEQFAKWAAEVPEEFVFAVKGSRYITHLKRLRGVEAPLANFFASGVLALQDKLGPFLWQFPAHQAFDEGLFSDFIDQLPQDTAALARLARRHDERLDGRSYTKRGRLRPVRHAFEVRSASFLDERFLGLLEQKGAALVIADTAGNFPYSEALTADFVYVRLHGSRQMYRSGYGPRELDRWAERIRAWASGRRPSAARGASAGPSPDAKPRDVYVYFDNTDDKLRAPRDALALLARLNEPRSRSRRSKSEADERRR